MWFLSPDPRLSETGTVLLWRIMKVLLVCMASCLLVVNGGDIINRCVLAKMLHQEDLDGFEGYSLPDCECCGLISHPSSSFLIHLPFFAICLSKSSPKDNLPALQSLSQHATFKSITTN